MQRFQPLLFQPVPSEVGYELGELVEEVRAAYFREVDTRFEVRIARVTGSPLACIYYNLMGGGDHVIAFHPAMNHRATPREVLVFLAKHELTHAMFPGEDHSAAFWKHESFVAPERYAAWAWLFQNMRPALRRTPDGHIHLHRSWRKLLPDRRAPYTPHLPFEADPFDRLCPEGGAQLRIPPNWDLHPATAAIAGA